MTDDTMVGIQVDFGAMDIREFCMDHAEAAAYMLKKPLRRLQADIDYVGLYDHMESACGAVCCICGRVLAEPMGEEAA